MWAKVVAAILLLSFILYNYSFIVSSPLLIINSIKTNEKYEEK